MSRNEAAAVSNPLKGMLLLVCAFFMFAFNDAGAKYLVLAGVHPVFVNWMRFFTHGVLAVVILRPWVNSDRFRVGNMRLQLFRGVVLFVSGILSFSSLLTLQLVEFVAIFFAAPIWVTLLARLVLKESLDWMRIVAVVIGFGGVIIISRPGMGVLGIGHVMAFAATLAYGVFIIATRLLTATESHESLFVMPPLVAIVLGLPALPFVGSLPPDGLYLAILLSLGAFGAIGHWLLIHAYRIAPASFLAPFIYVHMIWTVIFGYIIFDSLPDAWTISGTLTIVASGLLLVASERKGRAKALR